jgi:S-DNA-T family DNA segregation ATPase FtsK/SpoIIIE
MEITIMTNEPIEPGWNGEVVPFRPAVDPGAERQAPEVLPAVPGVPGVPGDGPARVVFDARRVPGERLPVIPPNWRSRQEIRASLALIGAQQWHRARFHGLRSPVYLLMAVFWAVAGIMRLVAVQLAWWVLEQHGLRSDAAANGDSREWMRLHKEAKETRKARGAVLAFEVLLAAGGCVALVRFAPPWAQFSTAAVALPALAWLGRPDGKPIIGQAIIPTNYEPPTQDSITRALGSLGISAINKAIAEGRFGPGTSFVSPVMQAGPGWGVQLDLPHGVTAADIIARRRELASGLRRPLSATWPEGVPAEHEGRLSLWVGFHDISKMKPPKYPLARSGATDIFAPVPFGTDPRGRAVAVPLFEVNWLIGAAPGQGKTSAVRVLGCGAALDPVAVMWVHELAGKGDLEPFAQVSDRYCSGLDDEAVEYAAESARLLRGELEKRSAIFKRLPREAKPDGKLTRELALAHPALRPLVAVFDEAQNLFIHPQLGAQAAADIAHVERLGRAYGIIIKLSTQRPDKDSVPPAVSGITTARFCLKVPDYLGNDMVLGTGAYKAGYNACLFRTGTDAGLGWLKADGEPQIVRTYYLDLPATEKITARARVMRKHAGVLAGYALGDEVAKAPARDVLADALEVFGDAAGLHWDELAERLAGRWPERWADITGEALSAQLRSHGVPSVTVSSGGVKARGCRKVAVEREVYK